jgi:hypothetical protein
MESFIFHHHHQQQQQLYYVLMEGEKNRSLLRVRSIISRFASFFFSFFILLLFLPHSWIGLDDAIRCTVPASLLIIATTGRTKTR